MTPDDAPSNDGTQSAQRTQRKKSYFAIFAVFAFLFPAVMAAQTPQAGAPRTIDKGEQSNVEDARQVVVRTEAEWTKLWQQHTPDRTRPAVDFSKEMIVGVFMGSRPTAGYNISIVSTFTKDGSVLVRYEESRPRPGAITAQVLTFPYHLVAIPKASGDVMFEKIP